MRSGKCPKCGANNIYCAENAFQRDVLQMPLGGMTDGVASFSMMDYVCTDCGYAEQYIQNRDVLKKIPDLAAKGKRWSKVGQ